MKSSLEKTAFLTLITMFLLAPAAAAPIYQYNVNNPGGNDAAGNVSNITTTYNSNTEVFDWVFTIEDVGGSLSNGFWLAISDGPNPKGTLGELVLFYGDVLNNQLTAYEYNGQNNATSWSNPGNFLGSYNLNSSDNGTDSRTVSLSVDATSLNALNLSPEWRGVQFGSHLGYWFHPFLNGAFGYDASNHITSFSMGTQGWYDYSNLATTEVPEPASMLLLATGLFGLRARKAKQ